MKRAKNDGSFSGAVAKRSAENQLEPAPIRRESGP